MINEFIPDISCRKQLEVIDHVHKACMKLKKKTNSNGIIYLLLRLDEINERRKEDLTINEKAQ